MSVVFNKPCFVGVERDYVVDACSKGKLSGDGYYSRQCEDWFESYLGCKRALLTPSCTAALEMAAILLNLTPGDEVIMPSYTFVSTANAFVLRGAKVVFVDIRADTMNIDEALIEEAITPRTKAVVVVHYAGVSCEMDVISEITNRHGLYLIEDAAQAMTSTYKTRKLGTIGHIATYSFHDTKNFTSGGEGGLLIINDSKFVARAEVLREKGTNRSNFLRGEVDKYTWIDLGSSYLPSDLQAAYLWGQLNHVSDISIWRQWAWAKYYNGLTECTRFHRLALPVIPDECSHNAHMFYVKLPSANEALDFNSYMNDKGIKTCFHYVPLHTSEAGSKFGRFSGEDKITTEHSLRLVRLPLYYGISEADLDYVICKVCEYEDVSGETLQLL